MEQVGTPTDNSGSKFADTSYHNLLQMPQGLNPHENNIRRSPCLRKQRESGEINKRKARAIFGRVATTKVRLGLFLSMALATNDLMPEHQTNEKLTFNKQAINRLHEVNELYNGTLNSVDQYSTEIAVNASFVFRNTMKQKEKKFFS